MKLWLYICTSVARNHTKTFRLCPAVKNLPFLEDPPHPFKQSNFWIQKHPVVACQASKNSFVNWCCSSTTEIHATQNLYHSEYPQGSSVLSQLHFFHMTKTSHRKSCISSRTQKRNSADQRHAVEFAHLLTVKSQFIFCILIVYWPVRAP